MEIQMECRIDKKIKTVYIDDEDSWLLDYCIWNLYDYLRNQWKINTTFHRYIMMDKIKEFSEKNNIPIRKVQIDHMNQNKLDNRKVNLRCVNYVDNSINRKMAKNNTSGIKGIMLKSNGSYRVGLTYNGVKYRPTFKTLQEALDYRKNKLKELNAFDYKNN